MSSASDNPRAHMDPAELADLYAAGALTPAEHVELERRLAAGDAELTRNLARVQPVLEALLDAPEASVPRHLREGIEARIDTAASADAQEWAEQRGSRSIAAHACGEPGERGGVSPGTSAALLILRSSDARWTPTGIRGVRFRTLCADRRANRRTIVLHMDPGTSLPDHDHAGPEEVYVVSGDLSLGDELLGPGDYFRVPAGAEHGTPRTKNGCTCIIVSDYVPYTVRSLPRFLWTAFTSLFGKQR